MNLEIVQVEGGISLKEKEVYCGCLKKDMLIILLCVWGWGQKKDLKIENIIEAWGVSMTVPQLWV